ncbi:MAG: two-component regulator propeller domain-containing protein [Flavobacteriales bacterium]
MTLRYSLAMLCVFALKIVCSQNTYSFRTINTEDGLSANRVNAIMQDSRGFMWFATDNGLNRYDGRECIVYSQAGDAKNSLSGNNIQDMLEDQWGNIWLACSAGGLCKYDFRKNQFVSFLPAANNVSHEGVWEVNTIELATDSTLWIGTTNHGLFLFNQHNSAYTAMKEMQLSDGNKIENRAYQYLDIERSTEGTFYFGTLGYSMQVMNNKTFQTLHKEEKNHDAPYSVNCIYADEKQNVWFGAWDNALHKYNVQTAQVEVVMTLDNAPFSHTQDEVISIAEDANGLLWLGTRLSGLYIYNTANGNCENIRKDFDYKFSINSNAVRCVCRDDHGRMWLGTDSGVCLYNPFENHVEVNFMRDVSEYAGDESVVYDFLDDGNNLLIATSTGLVVRNKTTHAFSTKQLTYKGTPLQITNLFRHSDGRIFIGTNKSLFILNTQDYSIRPMNTFYSRPTDGFDFFDIPASRITSIAEGHWKEHPVVWASVYGHGVAVFDSNNLSGFISTINAPDDIEHLVRKVMTDSAGHIWMLGQQKGIAHNISFHSSDTLQTMLSHKATGLAQTITQPFRWFTADYILHRQDDQKSLLTDDVRDMVEDVKGEFWVSTSTGLQKFYAATLKFETVVEDLNNVKGLMKTTSMGQQQVWMIADGNLTCYEPATNRLHALNTTSGLPSEDLRGNIFASSDGYCYAGGNGYFIRFHPESMLWPQSKPKLKLTHFSIFNTNADSLLHLSQISLSHRQNFFSFEFVLLDYADPSTHEYAYMLVGINETWQYSGSRGFAGYTNLSGGDYTFMVKAKNSEGQWSDVVSIPLHIIPPFWQRAWFYPGLICFALLLFFVFYKNRIAKLNSIQTEKLVAEIDGREKERRRIARDLHDDFGTRMSALKIYLGNFEKHISSDDEQVRHSKNELHHLVDTSMSDLRSLLMDLSPKTLEMQGFAAAVHELASRTSISNNIKTDVFVEPILQQFDASHQLPLFRMVQELVMNSIKYAQCGEIVIQLFYRDGNLVLHYEDDGKGFNLTESNAKGFGIKNIETRATLLKGKMMWESKPGNGMSATIEIPYTPSTKELRH